MDRHYLQDTLTTSLGEGFLSCPYNNENRFFLNVNNVHFILQGI